MKYFKLVILIVLLIVLVGAMIAGLRYLDDNQTVQSITGFVGSVSDAMSKVSDWFGGNYTRKSAAVPKQDKDNPDEDDPSITPIDVPDDYRHIVVGDVLEVGDTIYFDMQSMSNEAILAKFDILNTLDLSTNDYISYSCELFGNPNIVFDYYKNTTHPYEQDCYYICIGDKVVMWYDLDTQEYHNDPDPRIELCSESSTGHYGLIKFPAECTVIEDEQLCSLFYIKKGNAS